MTVPGLISNEADDATTPPVRELASLDIAGQKDASAEVPAHLSHDPAKNAKRTDPFQFGSRFLSETDDVFEFNAWDHVETDDAYKEYAESQFEMQRQAPVSDFDKSKSIFVSFRTASAFFPLVVKGVYSPMVYMMITKQCIVHLKLLMRPLPS